MQENSLFCQESSCHTATVKVTALPLTDTVLYQLHPFLFPLGIFLYILFPACRCGQYCSKPFLKAVEWGTGPTTAICGPKTCPVAWYLKGKAKGLLSSSFQREAPTSAFQPAQALYKMTKNIWSNVLNYSIPLLSALVRGLHMITAKY